MRLELINNIINNLKDNDFIQNFIEEITKHLKQNDASIDFKIDKIEFNNLLSKDLTLYGNKITAKYRDIMIQERGKILNNYAYKTREKGELLYIYNKENSSYDIANITQNSKTITKTMDEVPKESRLGCVLRKNGDKIELDKKATTEIAEEINSMIKEKIEEQKKYLASKRIDGHIYKVGEKYSGRIWLYDLETKVDGVLEGIEEIEISQDLYNNVKEGDLLIFENDTYRKKMN